LIAGLLADHDDSRVARAFAKDGLRGAGEEWAALAVSRGLGERWQGASRWQEVRRGYYTCCFACHENLHPPYALCIFVSHLAE
jgi:hypothetical protein